MVPKRRVTSPRFGPSEIELRPLPGDPGHVEAYGVPDFPRYLTFTVRDPALPYGVFVHVHTAQDGRSAATGVQVVPLDGMTEPVPGVLSVLETMRLEDFVGEAVGLQVLTLQRVRYDELSSDDPEVAADAAKRVMHAVQVSRQYRSRRYNQRGPALLEEVAQIYTEAYKAGESPTRAVQQKARGGHNAYSTAAAWVRQARKAGLLPPAVKGRPGWKDGS